MMVTLSSLRPCAVVALFLATTGQAQWDHNQYTSSPQVTPSPKTSGRGWEESLEKAKQFVSQLSLDEKVQMVTGTSGPCVGNIAPIPHMNFSGLCLQDGPLAIRLATYASVFPAGLTAAASWDKGLIYQRGLYMGAEFKGKGAHVALSPVVGPLGRCPRSGRNWEGFSPDPYLSAVAVEQTISGMQKAGTQACVKHYIGNEQETQRNPAPDSDGKTIEAVSSNIDDRTLHELYLWPFANAVKSGVSSVMCSYNRLNGTYACQNSKILNGVLKEELGFQGYVMSDWFATHAGAESALAGLDMDMPGGEITPIPEPSYFGQNLKKCVQNGTVSENRLDDMCHRVLIPYFQLGQDKGFPLVDPSEVQLNEFSPPPYVHQFPLNSRRDVDVRDNHHTLIRELGAAGTVLLKNTNKALPLKAPRTIAVLGNDAGDEVNGLYFSGEPFAAGHGFEYGTQPVAGGSGTGRFSTLISPLEAIKARAYQDRTVVQYMLNHTYIVADGLENLAPTPPDACIVFLKSWASEGYDRPSLIPDWDSSNVVNNITAVCNNTIVVTHSAGLNVLPWHDNPNVTAILAAHLPGEESGNAIVDVLYGAVNPSGKLPYTIAMAVSDYDAFEITNSSDLLNTHDPNAWQADFKEGLLIDYKWFDYHNVTPAYHFGHGLSYTDFAMADLSVRKSYGGGAVTSAAPAADIIPGGQATLWDCLYQATLTVSNTGDVAGAAVPQLYVALPAVDGEAPSPPKQLRGFEKLSIQPGASTTVSFDLLRRDLSYWSSAQQQWLIPEGEVVVMVGWSSGDIRLNQTVTVVDG